MQANKGEGDTYVSGIVKPFYTNYFESFGLQLGDSDTRGRHVVVGSEGASKGELLFSAQPYAAILRPPFIRSHCHYCFKSSRTLAKRKESSEGASKKKCSVLIPCKRGCRFAFYCDTECESNDWALWHQIECEGLRNIQPPTLPNENVMLMWRLLNRRRNEQQSLVAEQDTRRFPWQVIDFMITHYQDYHPQDIKHFEFLVDRYFLPFLVPTTQTGLTTTKEQIVSFFCFFFCNNFTIYDNLPESLGIGVYPSGALMNHSCRPNTAVTFEGNVAHIRALVDIPPGQEITINYIEIDQPKRLRKKQLMETFFFDCWCEWCQITEEEHVEDPSLDDESIELLKAKQLHDEGALCKQEGNLEASKAALEESLSVLREWLKYANEEERESHYQIVGTINELVDVTFKLKEWKECLVYCRGAVRGLEKIFKSYHYWVMTGLRYVRIARLCVKLRKENEKKEESEGTEKENERESFKEEGLAALERASEVLKVTHGEGHSVFSEIERLGSKLRD